VRLLAAVLLAVALAGCGAEEPARPASTPEPATQAPIVADAREAADWVAKALESSGYRADFSPSSGWELDRFFDDQLKAPGEPKRGGLLAEDVGPRLFAIGAYVGEIIRRHSTGWKWVPDKDDPDDEINLSLRRGDEVVWPIQRVMKRYGEGEESGIAIYLVSVAELDVGPRPAG
jgi:hypothetical protein